MKLKFNYIRFSKAIILVLIFAILMLSITRNIIESHAVSSTQEAVCVPIFMYHQVKNTNLGKDVVSPYEFESDLNYLSENGYTTITMADLIDYVYNDKDLPDKPVILTIDDGYLSTYKNVFPLLQKYNMKIVLSVVGKTVDDFSRVVDNNISYAFVTWNQVKQMQESGLVEIQNHTYNLHKICNGRYGCYQKVNETISHYEQLLTEDILKLQDQIAATINITPTTFTYPYGKYNDETEKIIKKLGFKATLSATYGVNMINKDPERLFGLKRICRSHNHTVQNLMKEGLKTLRYLNE